VSHVAGLIVSVLNCVRSVDMSGQHGWLDSVSLSMLANNATALLILSSTMVILSSFEVQYRFLRRNPPAWMRHLYTMLNVCNLLALNVLGVLCGSDTISYGRLATGLQYLYLASVSACIIASSNISLCRMNRYIRAVRHQTTTPQHHNAPRHSTCVVRTDHSAHLTYLVRVSSVCLLAILAYQLNISVTVLNDPSTFALPANPVFTTPEYFAWSQAFFVAIVLWFMWIPIRPLQSQHQSAFFNYTLTRNSPLAVAKSNSGGGGKSM